MIGGTTIHKWAGLGDGRHTPHQVIEKMELEQLKIIKSCHTLIIDEMSMLSKKLFEDVELICQLVRQQELPFGGLQVILCGDLLQVNDDYDYN